MLDRTTEGVAFVCELSFSVRVSHVLRRVRPHPCLKCSIQSTPDIEQHKQSRNCAALKRPPRTRWMVPKWYGSDSATGGWDLVFPSCKAAALSIALWTDNVRMRPFDDPSRQYTVFVLEVVMGIFSYDTCCL